jgi:hypothetical protein
LTSFSDAGGAKRKNERQRGFPDGALALRNRRSSVRFALLTEGFVKPAEMPDGA